MTVTLDRVQPTETPALAATEPTLRLSLTPDGTAPGRLDGAWWPRSHDLLIELPLLVAELDERWGRVTRVVLNPTHWPVIPHLIPVAGHVVRCGWFRQEQDENEVMVRPYAVRRLDLLVVPPQTGEAEAGMLMSAAAGPTNARTASELLAQRPADMRRPHRQGGSAEPVEGSDSRGSRDF
ncbi:DUF5994 family protein [Kitasatospora sp. NBC_01302]|uniref:DUF5994 family protein n=1 Tax=Kitasatospora sp. NBC_01302 TaxID=2903575 RepID=UPI002E0F8621|nr:DUF5994 family protein [Kitasatospora sp. NBC_01302]